MPQNNEACAQLICALTKMLLFLQKFHCHAPQSRHSYKDFDHRPLPSEPLQTLDYQRPD